MRYVNVWWPMAAALACAPAGSVEARPKPFVKWAGGKGQLLGQLSALLPEGLADEKDVFYVEPFVGGGAMLFHMLERYTNITHVVVNDLNADLMTAYRMVMDRPEELIGRLRALRDEYAACPDEAARKAMFLEKRRRYNERPQGDGLETASLFIFLNRTCYNGMYRVNAEGRYNVPFGKAARPLICDEETIRADSRLLNRAGLTVELLTGDFEEVGNRLGGQGSRKAFLYFDPPYRPLTPTASFTAYDKAGFGDVKQQRLAAFCRTLHGGGHRWLLSNSDPKNVNPDDAFFEDLYRGFSIHRVQAARMINSKASGRGKVSELAICNYGPGMDGGPARRGKSE